MSLETITPASTIDTPDVLAPITEMNWALEMTQFRQRNLGNTACGGCPKIDLCGDTGVCADENETTELVPEQEAENNVKLEDDNPIAINTVPALDEPQPAPEKSQPTQVETKATVAEDPKASDIIKPIDIIPELSPASVEQKLPDSVKTKPEEVPESKKPELSSGQVRDTPPINKPSIAEKPISKDSTQSVKVQGTLDIKVSEPTTQPTLEPSRPTQVEKKTAVQESPKVGIINKPVGSVPELPPATVERELPNQVKVQPKETPAPKKPELLNSQVRDALSIEKPPVVEKPISRDPVPQDSRHLKVSEQHPVSEGLPKQSAPATIRPVQAKEKGIVEENPRANTSNKTVDIVPELPVSFVEQKLPDSAIIKAENIPEPKETKPTAKNTHGTPRADTPPVAERPISRDPVPQDSRHLKVSEQQPVSEGCPTQVEKRGTAEEDPKVIAASSSSQSVETIQLHEIPAPQIGLVSESAKSTAEVRVNLDTREVNSRVSEIEAQPENEPSTIIELTNNLHKILDAEKVETMQVKEFSLNVEPIYSEQSLPEQKPEQTLKLITQEMSNRRLNNNKETTNIRVSVLPLELTPLLIKADELVPADVVDVMGDSYPEVSKDIPDEHKIKLSVEAVHDLVISPTDLDSKSGLGDSFTTDREIIDTKVVEIRDDMLLPNISVDLRAFVAEEKEVVEEKEISVHEIVPEAELSPDSMPVLEEILETDSLILDEDKIMQELQPDIPVEVIDDVSESVNSDVQDQEYFEEESSNVLKKIKEEENIDKKSRSKDILVLSDETEVVLSNEDEPSTPTVRARSGGTSSLKPKSPLKVASMLGVIALFHSLTDIMNYKLQTD